MSLIAEIKRRNVAKVAVLYIVASWLILQVADVGVSLLELPDWIGKTVFLFLALGFPLAVAFSWIYELTPEGLKREKEIDRSESITHETGHRINVLIVVLLILAIGAVIADRLIPETRRPPAADTPSAIDEPAARSRPADSSIVAGAKFAPRPDKSIAVLPFADMSPDGDQEYFSDGLSEELLNLLAKVPELQVASRTSAFSFKGKDVKIADVAAELNVAHVLEGSVRKAGDTIRITAQLIDADRDVHLWSETWDRTLNDVFAIQDEIAVAVVDELKVTLLGEEPKATETDPEAYTLFLRARQLGRQGSADSMMQALPLYTQALDIDPDYAPAWDGMGSAYTNLANFQVIPEDEGYAKAKAAFEQALKVDPDNARARAGLGWHATEYLADYVTAARYYREALERDPQDIGVLNGAAVLLQTLGRIDEGIAIHEYLVERDPLNETTLNNLASAYMDAERYDEAQATLDRVRALSPDMLTAHIIQAVLAWYRDDIDLYVAELDAIADKSGVEGWRLLGRAAGYPRIGRQAEGDAALDELKANYAEDWVYGIAYAYCMRDDTEQCIEWLEKVVEYDDRESFGNMRSDTWVRAISGDPRVQAVLEKAGLSDAQVAAIDLEVDLPQ
jgi:TolB-like protein/cytochrome c-type biogenesis protein CcmH/NrfG